MENRIIYVGNLPEGVTDDELRSLFAPHGDVISASLVIEPQTGLPRGFGFVEMPAEEAFTAIEALDGHDHRGSVMRVNEARNRGAKPPRRAW